MCNEILFSFFLAKQNTVTPLSITFKIYNIVYLSLCPLLCPNIIFLHYLSPSATTNFLFSLFFPKQPIFHVCFPFNNHHLSIPHIYRNLRSIFFCLKHGKCNLQQQWSSLNAHLFMICGESRFSCFNIQLNACNWKTSHLQLYACNWKTSSNLNICKWFPHLFPPFYASFPQYFYCNWKEQVLQ